jgi:hypothetical protein
VTGEALMASGTFNPFRCERLASPLELRSLWISKGAPQVSVMLALGMLLWCATPTGASIIATSGDMTEIAGPVSFLAGETESSSTIFIFDEGTTLLTEDVFVNAFGVGTHDGSAPPYLIIPAGTRVNSYLVHFDPVGTSFTTLTGTVYFEAGETILGVQTHTPLLYATDGLLGDPSATYPTAFDEFRAFETLPGTDTVTLPVAMDSASFTLFAELGVDQARILTYAIPEPSTFVALAGLVLCFTAARCRRRGQRRR